MSHLLRHSSQTMLEGLCGCFMTCNVFLAGNSRGGTIHRFCSRIVEKTSFLFPFPFSAFPEISPKTRFPFQHFPKPRQNVVSVFLVNFFFFCFFPGFLVFLPLFFQFFPVFSIFLLKNDVSCSAHFPFTPISRLKFRLVSHFLPISRLELPRF